MVDEGLAPQKQERRKQAHPERNGVTNGAAARELLLPKSQDWAPYSTRSLPPPAPFAGTHPLQLARNTEGRQERHNEAGATFRLQQRLNHRPPALPSLAWKSLDFYFGSPTDAARVAFGRRSQRGQARRVSDGRQTCCLLLLLLLRTQTRLLTHRLYVTHIHMYKCCTDSSGFTLPTRGIPTG